MFEQFDIFSRGLILGVMISAPVGPIGLLCIRRTLQRGLIVGFATGLGAALADTLFGAIAAFGVAAIMDFIHHYQMGLRIVGGGMLLYGAWHTWHDMPKPPPEPMALVKKVIGLGSDTNIWGVIKAGISSFAITLTNPVSIFAVLAVVATFSRVESRLDAASIISGIFVGSAAWWATLSGGIALVRGHFTESRIVIVNRVTAAILAGLAIYAMVTGITELAQRLQTMPT